MDIENSIALAREQGLEKGLSQGKAAGIKEGLSQGKAEERTRGINNLIYSLERLGTPKATIKQNLMELYQLSSKEAESYLN
jgi:flagellar biosynthesis/type III secretory pathway protein FliH